MVSDINAAITVCNANIHVYSISTSSSLKREKAYYQHRHPSLEIHYVISGQCRVTCSGNTFTVPAESMLLIPPGTYHDVSPEAPNTSRLCLSFSVKKRKKENHCTDHADSFYSIYNQSNPIVAGLQNCDAQKTLLKLIKLSNKEEIDKFKNDKMLMLCGSLLLELLPHIAEAAPFNTVPDTDHVQEDVSFKIDSFLGTNFMHNNAKSRMAADLFISPRQLQRIIKKNYGMNYRQKLSETRVQIAIDLLSNSDMPIHKIAEILGYSCSANFSAFIKRVTGKTPSQIRNER